MCKVEVSSDFRVLHRYNIFCIVRLTMSALIHATTMTTNVIFMIARCSPLFEYSPTALIVITSVRATTSFLAATNKEKRKTRRNIEVSLTEIISVTQEK